LISDADLLQLERQLPHLDPAHKRRVLELLEERERVRRLQEARDHFLPFVKMMWPEFIPGAHHTIMAEAFEKIAKGELKRLLINMPPRFTKSELSSWLLPAWLLGRQPTSKIIQASNTEALAAGFGRKVRNLVSGEGGDTEQTTHPFQDVFPGVWLAKDSQAAAGWHTNRGGEYFAIGVNGKVTGKGANCAYFSCKCLTKRGYILIADVRVGDEVLGYDHRTETPTWTTVRAISTQRKPELVSVNGFVGTPEHRVYTRRGYRRALAARADQDDVLSLPAGFHQAFEGLPAGGAQNRAPARQAVLFRRVQVEPGAVRLPSMRGLESADGDHLQALLSEGQARPSDVQELLERIQASEVHAGQERSAGRFQRQSFLHTELLSGVLRGEPKTLDRRGHRLMQNLRRASSEERRKVLLNEMLLGTGQGSGRALHGGLEPGTGADQEALQRAVRGMRPDDGSRAGAPHRQRLYEPYRGELGAALRAVPRVLSSTRVGDSASDVEGALHGLGHWVVDIQTDSENFFCEGVLVHNCAIIDDAHSEQEAKQAESNPAVFDSVWEWYSSGIRQRLQPGGAIVIPMTRWSKRDLAGRLIKQMQESTGLSDKWEVISFPAILDEGTPTERSMWPGFWPLEELQRTRAALPVSKWSAQYLQNPVSEQAAILKREYWRRWGDDEEKCPGPMHAAAWQNGDPPACDYIIGSWDCASTKNERSHPSAYTLWGVFRAEDPDSGKTVNNIILLSSFTARMEFPELKKKAKEFYDEDSPDTLLIENKAAGIQLLQEFRAMGIPAEDFSGSSRGTKALPNDKIARANMVVDIFASKYVWAPSRRFADVVIEECASFPAGDTDDLVDSTVQAMIRFRQGGFIRTANDEPEEETVSHRRKRYY